MNGTDNACSVIWDLPRGAFFLEECWAYPPNYPFVFCLINQTVNSSRIGTASSYLHPWQPAQILAHSKNAIWIQWISKEGWILGWKNEEIHILSKQKRCPSSLELRSQRHGLCVLCFFQDLALTWPLTCHFYPCLALPARKSWPWRWDGLGAAPGGCWWKERLLPYLLAVGFLPLSGSRALCRSLQGGRRPHRTGKGPWNSHLLSSGLWGSTPWLAHSSPAQPGAGRLQRKGAKREGAINTTAAASECLSLVLPLGSVKVYTLQTPGLYRGLYAREFVIKWSWVLGCSFTINKPCILQWASYLALHYGLSCAPRWGSPVPMWGPFSHLWVNRLPWKLSLTSHQSQGQGQGEEACTWRLSASFYIVSRVRGAHLPHPNPSPSELPWPPFYHLSI